MSGSLFRSLVISRDVLPAPNQRDTILEAIADVRDKMQQAPADESKTKLSAAVGAACNGAQECRDVLWRLVDDHEQRLRALNEFLSATREQGESSVPPYGHGSPTDYEAAKRAAGEKVVGVAIAKAAQQSLAGVTDSANTAAKSFASGMEALRLAVDAEYGKWTGPAAMREAPTLQRIAQEAAIEREVKTWDKPMRRALSHLLGLVERGADDEVDLFLAGIGSVVGATLASPIPRIAQTGSETQDERSAAAKIRQIGEQVRRARMPQSIEVANECLQDLGSIFRTLIGNSQTWMSRAQFGQFLSFGGPDEGKPFQATADWTSRVLRTASAPPRLPGWTPVVAQMSLGGKARAPR